LPLNDLRADLVWARHAKAAFECATLAVHAIECAIVAEEALARACEIIDDQCCGGDYCAVKGEEKNDYTPCPRPIAEYADCLRSHLLAQARAKVQLQGTAASQEASP